MCDNGFAAQLKLNRFFPPSSPPHSRFFDPPPLIYSHFSSHLHTHICSSNAYGYRRPPQHSIFSFTTPPNAFFHPDNKPVRGGFSTRAAAPRQSPYQVLGVSLSATPDDIKRAYRKLALKYHPDVNKEPGAQEKFMRIKHAYNTLLDSKSRGNYDQDGRSFDYSYTQRNRTTRNSPVKEDFYGLGEFIRDVQLTLADFFRDVQEEFRNWETSASSQGKPKSLWEELSEIGEEFVEFLEKELNITDSEDKADFSGGGSQKDNLGADPSGSNMKNEAGKNISIEDNIDEIEATLAQLKKDLGL